MSLPLTRPRDTPLETIHSLFIYPKLCRKPVRLADDPDQRQSGDGAGDQAGDANGDEYTGESGWYRILEEYAGRQQAEVGAKRPADDVGEDPGGQVGDFTAKDGILEDGDNHSEGDETDEHSEWSFR